MMSKFLVMLWCIYKNQKSNTPSSISNDYKFCVVVYKISCALNSPSFKWDLKWWKEG